MSPWPVKGVPLSSQVYYLIVLCLKTNLWRCLGSAIVIVSLVSNNFFPIGYSRGTINTENRLLLMNSTNLGIDNLMFVNSLAEEQDAVVNSLANMTNQSINFIDRCTDSYQCSVKFLDHVLRDPSKYFGLTNYLIRSSKSLPTVVCQVSHGSELYCPILSYLAVGSVMIKEIQQIRHLSLMSVRDHFELDPGRIHLGKEPFCATSSLYVMVFPQILSLQSLLLTAAFYFYCLIGNAACICKLKSNSFLQIMFQRGLSVRAFWLAVWFITLAEASLFSIISAVSYYSQCAQFYNVVALLKIMFMTLMQFISGNSLCLLYTVIMGSRLLVSISLVFTCIITLLVILFNRIFFKDWLKLLTLMLPFANLVNSNQCTLLEEVNPHSSNTYFHHLVLIFTFIRPAVFVTITMYLDWVLRTGNGLRLPFAFFKNKRFWRKILPVAMDTLQVPEMSEDELGKVEQVKRVTPVVYAKNLLKEFPNGACCKAGERTKAINGLSFIIQKGKITALLGSNGAGKTTLLNILTTQSSIDGGDLIIAGYSIKNPQATLRLRGHLGISPGVTALCKSLTVRDTLRLLCISAGGTWRDYGDEAIRLMEKLGLIKLQDRLVSDLSRTKRMMLCLMMALLGPIELVVIDEFTQSLDATTRMRVWDVLLQYRRSRSIVVSTQQMNEAEAFADWMICLSNGSLRCCGSPQFFCTTYNCGLQLNMQFKNEEHVELLLTALRSKCNSIRLYSKSGCTVQLRIPHNEIKNAEAAVLLLENYKKIFSLFTLTHEDLQFAYLNRKTDNAVFWKNSKEDQGSNSPQTDILCDVASPNNETLGGATETQITQPSPVAQQSQTSGSSNILTATLSVNFKRSVRRKDWLCFKIIIPFIQILTIIGGALIEESMRKQSDYNLADFKTIPFTRGICIVDQTEDGTNSSQTLCKNFFDKPSAKESQFIAIYKKKNLAMNIWVLREHIILKLKEHCTTPMEPCPFVHLGSWNATPSLTPVTIGVFIRYGEYAARSATAATLTALKYVLKTLSIDSDMQVQGILDLRMTTIPLYGLYFHLIMLSTLPVIFLNDIIEDKASKVRLQLHVLGTGAFKYWLVTCFIHWLQYALLYVCSSVILIAVLPSTYMRIYYWIRVILPTLLLGLLCNQLLIYTINAIFSPSYHAVSIGCLLYTLLLFTLIHVVQHYTVVSQVLLFLVPQFASIALPFYVARKILIAEAYFKNSDLAKRAIADLPEPNEFMAIVAMVFHLFVLIISLACLENGRCLLNTIRAQGIKDKVEEDDIPRNSFLIKDQEIKIKSSRIVRNPHDRAYSLEVRALTKEYQKGVKALNCITFALKPGEIFGLVGPNDAGKTTLARLLTGEEQPTRGACDIAIRDNWNRPDHAARQRGIGYCPQYCPLYDYITAREHLLFYAAVLGIPPDRAGRDVDNLIATFDLKLHQDILAVNMFSGYRRRLCIAISFLGNPSVVILDDLFRGIDPTGKLLVSEGIKLMTTRENITVLFTTTSLDEAKHLCDTVGVLCDGYLLAIGTIEEIRSPYRDDFKLELLFSKEASQFDIDSAINQTQQKFLQARRVDGVGRRRVTFIVPAESIAILSETFHWLEALKAERRLDFSLRFLSLDEMLDLFVQQKELLIFPSDNEPKEQQPSIKSQRLR